MSVLKARWEEKEKAADRAFREEQEEFDRDFREEQEALDRAFQQEREEWRASQQRAREMLGGNQESSSPNPGPILMTTTAILPVSVLFQKQQVPPVTYASLDHATPLKDQECECVTQPDDQVVPGVTDASPLVVSLPAAANNLPPSPGTPVGGPGAEVPTPTPQQASAVQGDVQDHQRLVDEVQHLKTVIQEKDVALAESAVQVHQHSFLLAQRDAELVHTQFQLRQASASLQYSHYPQHHHQQMAEIHRAINRDTQQLQQHLHCLQGQVGFLQAELHAANAEVSFLQADCQQLQQQNQALKAEQSRDERQRYVRSQKSVQMRELKEDHKAETAVLHVAYRKLLKTTVERDQTIAELQAMCQWLANQLPHADVTRPKDVESVIDPVAQPAVMDILPELLQVAPDVPGLKPCDVKMDLRLCPPRSSTSVT